VLLPTLGFVWGDGLAMAYSYAKLLRDIHPARPILAAIGATTVNLNHLQAQMDDMVWSMLGIDAKRGFALCAPFRFNGRLDMLQSVGTYFFRERDAAAQTHFKKLMQRIRQAYGHRNYIEHALIFGH
jgi:hypothetical protein